jgi:hypothetical protein
VTEPDDELISIEAERDARRGRDRDGVSSLRDVEAEQGDEEEVIDELTLDDRAAREAGAQLDGRDEPEPQLD